jgi:8-oxo-dGTP diphosphatase
MAHSYEYSRASLTVDTVVLTVARKQLQVLLIERGIEPFAGSWAIPGGFVRVEHEALDHAAARELEEETGLTQADVFLEQLYTFGAPERDPRGRVVSVAYYALVSADLLPKVRGGDDARSARWFSVAEAQELALAFDHQSILNCALERVRGKIDYDPRIAAGLVPQEFTQAELRRAFEGVLGKALDRGNFSKRFARLRNDALVLDAEGFRDLPGSGRPPRLYRFNPGAFTP